MGGRRLLIALIAIVLHAAVLDAGTASADGGNSIAAATAIQPGVQEFGNTGNNTRVANRYRAFWSLSLTAGDLVVIDWEASDAVEFEPFPIGTNDFTLEHTEALTRQYPRDNGKNEMRLKASQSGLVPIMLSSTRPSAYSFTVYVQHALSVALPRLSGLRHRGTIQVGVHNPEGGAISDPSLNVELQVRRGTHWIAIGSAAVAESVAAVSYKVPRRLWGQRVSLRAVASGFAYISEKSRVVRLRVKR